MPKIFGKVVMVPNQFSCTCRLCNYTWKPTNTEYSDLLDNKKVTCPMCRLTKEHAPGKPIETTGPLSKYIVDTMVMGAMVSILRNEDKYKDYMVPIRSLECGHIFTVKSRYFYSWMKEPECLKCHPERASKLSDMDQAESVPTKVEVKPNTSKIYDTQKPKVESIDSEVDKNKKLKEQIEKDMMSLVGKDQNNSTIIGTDIANAEVIIHCNICGKEKHISYATYKKNTEDSLICADCKLKKPTLENLYTKYVGKVFNGMKITDVYRGGNKHTLCTVQCIDNKEHEYKNKELGVIINNRFYCPDCTGYGKRDIANIERIASMVRMACKRFFEQKYNTSGINRDNFGYNSYRKVPVSSPVPVGITAQQFYEEAIKQGKSICDFCIWRKQCIYTGETKTMISYISSQADLLDNINEAKSDIASRCPSIYSPMFMEGAAVCDVDVTRELIMLRDAYRGRDKLIYRFCKCIKHGTELLMSETEILDFDHNECMDTDKKVVRFFDLDNEILLGNKKDTKKKR